MTDQPKKSKKEIIAVACIVAAALVLCGLFTLLAGVALDYRSKVNEFKAFKDLPQAPAKIEFILMIEGDDRTFEVTDEIKIKQVTDIIFARVYKRSGQKEREIPASRIKFYNTEGKAFDIPTNIIKGANGYYYMLEKDDALVSVLHAVTGVVVV